MVKLFLAKSYKIYLQALRKISQRTKLGQKWAKWPPLRAKIACFVEEGGIVMAEDGPDDDWGIFYQNYDDDVEMIFVRIYIV